MVFEFLRPPIHKDKLVEKTSLSSFVREASSGEKKQVYKRVIEKATTEQRAVVAAANALSQKR